MKIMQAPLIETAILHDIMAVKVPQELRAMAEEDWHFFIDLRQARDLKIESLSLKTMQTHKHLRKYIYYTGDIERLLGPKSITAEGNQKFWEELSQYTAVSSLELLKNSSFDTKNLLYLSDANLWYSFRGDTPLSPTYSIDYIGGVANDSYDLDKAEAVLKKSPWVSRIRRIEIPYYNRDENLNRALEFLVRLPQKEYDKVVRYYRDEKKEEFWSCRVKDCLASSYGLEPFDILGLKAALLPRKN